MQLDEVKLRSLSFERFPFLLYVHFYSFTAAGIWDEVNVNELPDWDWAWSDGTKAVNWGSRKGSLRVFVFVLFFAVIHPTFKHAPWKESTIKRSVDDRFETFRWSAPKKCQDHLIFVIAVEWISPVNYRVQKRWPKEQLRRNASEKLQSSLTCITMRVAWKEDNSCSTVKLTQK